MLQTRPTIGCTVPFRFFILFPVDCCQHDVNLDDAPCSLTAPVIRSGQLRQLA